MTKTTMWQAIYVGLRHIKRREDIGGLKRHRHIAITMPGLTTTDSSGLDIAKPFHLVPPVALGLI